MKHNTVVIYSGTAGANFTTKAYSLGNMVLFAGVAAFTGGSSPVGSIKLQACNDKRSPDDNVATSTWVDITDPKTSVAAINGDMNVFWQYTNIGYRWIRAVYTRTSGTDTVAVTFTCKGY